MRHFVFVNDTYDLQLRLTLTALMPQKDKFPCMYGFKDCNIPSMEAVCSALTVHIE